MPISLENFQIHRLAVHEVFKREIGGVLVPPILNEELTFLDANGLRELQVRAIQAVGHKSHSIEMDFIDVTPGSVYSLIEPFLISEKDDTDFIVMSHQIVTKLVGSQKSRAIPGGIILVFQGTTGIDNCQCLGIIKADKHSGFTVDSTNQVAIVEYLSNLMLTPEQKLYKIALAVNNLQAPGNTATTNVIEVCVFDADNNKANSKAAAVYFYSDFLGCDYQKHDNVLTRDFFNHSKEFITKESGLSGDVIVNTMSALYSYLTVRTNPTLSVHDFADSYFLSPDLKQSYSSYMTSRGLPDRSFQRDVSMIEGRLKKRKIKFKNDVAIYAPIEDFNNRVELIEAERYPGIAIDDDETLVRIGARVSTES